MLDTVILQNKRLSYQHHITNEDLQTDAGFYQELVQTMTHGMF